MSTDTNVRSCTGSSNILASPSVEWRPAPCVAKVRSLRLDCEPGEERWLDGPAQHSGNERLGELAAMPFVRRVVSLPDVHWKRHMELPSSVAVDCGKALMPDVSSVAVNDCMSLILTDWHADQLDSSFLGALFRNVNRRAAQRRSELTAYSPSRSELNDILFEGAPAAVRKFRLPTELLDAMECEGRTTTCDIDGDELDRLVPGMLRRYPGFRAEFGLNFGGNHFLEVQYVTDLDHVVGAREWGLFPGQVAIMTHLGPGPFSGNLLHLYARREKVKFPRGILYYLLKVQTHFAGRPPAQWPARYRAYFRRQRFRGFPLDSELGVEVNRVLRLGSNFGFAYQVGSYKAVVDALCETARDWGLADPEPRLLWSVSHNHIRRERIGEAETLVARHNSVRAYPGKPALLAGSGEVDSCLGIGLDQGAAHLHSYDHGVGDLLARAKRAGALPVEEGSSEKFMFARGSANGPLSVERTRRRSRRLVERTVEKLKQHGIVEPVCYLRPLATMHN